MEIILPVIRQSLVMIVFTNKNISIAGTADVVPLRNLLNTAYRGEASKDGWTTESHLIDGGVRTDDAGIEQLMQKNNSVFLKYVSSTEQIIGCLNLQLHQNKFYLGMLSVFPKLQGGGIGRQLLHASEEYAAQLGCNVIYMTVISVRTELINWYKRHGYAETGELLPFKEDGKSGKHLQELFFIVLEKQLL